MGQNSALCLRFDLDTFESRHAYTADVGWGCYGNIPRLLRVAAALDAKFQFCACGEGLREYPFDVLRIREAGHSVDSHLYTHRVVLTDPAVRVAEELALTEQAFREHGVPWSGIGATGMYPNGIDDCPEVQELLTERGYQWCSTKYNSSLSLAEMQPYWLNEHLLEIPGAGMSDRAFFKQDEHAPVRDFIELVFSLLEQARRDDLVYSIDLHPGVLAWFDPECEFVTNVVERASELGVPMVTMDQITQWKIAQREAERFARGERPGRTSAWWHDCGWLEEKLGPGARPTFARYLEAEAAWQEKAAQPLQQPEKVIDYVGGWRTFPNSKRNGVTINRFGLRGSDCLRTAPRNTTRILCLGDSCVFGPPPDGAPWPAKLQQQLDVERPLEFQVLNAGVNGQSSFNLLLRLPQLLRGLQPDIVMISILANDAWSARPPDGTPLSDFQPVQFLGHLREAVDFCLSHQARPILITPPGMVPRDHPMTPYMLAVYHQALWLGEEKQPDKMRALYDIYNEAVRMVAVEKGISCLDIAAVFDDKLDDERGRLFADTCHMFQDGHEVMAHIIAELFIGP